jgi:ATP-dependent RNA helicase DHX29
MDKANQTWAKLMLQLDLLRSRSDNKKGGKKKGNSVVLETPEMRRVKGEMSKLEKEYMFSRKEAGASDALVKADYQTSFSSRCRRKLELKYSRPV